MSGEYDARYEDTALGTIVAFLKAAQSAGTISPSLDVGNTAIYLIGISMGTTNYWLYRTNNMDYSQAAELILLPAFSAITDEPIVYHDSLSEKRKTELSASHPG